MRLPHTIRIEEKEMSHSTFVAAQYIAFIVFACMAGIWWVREVSQRFRTERSVSRLIATIGATMMFICMAIYAHYPKMSGHRYQVVLVLMVAGLVLTPIGTGLSVYARRPRRKSRNNKKRAPIGTMSAPRVSEGGGGGVF